MGDAVRFRVEFEHDGPLHVVRPHRQFFGRNAVTEPIMVDLDIEETEPLYCCLDVDDSECTPGRSARCKIPGLVFTAEPHLFGTDADRLAAGKNVFVQTPYGEWSVLKMD